MLSNDFDYVKLIYVIKINLFGITWYIKFSYIRVNKFYRDILSRKVYLIFNSFLEFWYRKLRVLLVPIFRRYVMWCIANCVYFMCVLQTVCILRVYLFQIMMDCWKYEPKGRPSFEEIHKTVKDIYIENYAELTRMNSFSSVCSNRS